MTDLLKVNLLPNLRVTRVMSRLFNMCSTHVHSRQIQSALDKPRIIQLVIYRFRKITSPSNASSIRQAELNDAFAMRSHCVRSDFVSEFTSDFRPHKQGEMHSLTQALPDRAPIVARTSAKLIGVGALNVRVLFWDTAPLVIYAHSHFRKTIFQKVNKWNPN